LTGQTIFQNCTIQHLSLKWTVLINSWIYWITADWIVVHYVGKLFWIFTVHMEDW
jgi:hypothetical protein